MIYTHKEAFMSVDGLYRYWLVREWDHTVPKACFVMLNPSTADADTDDHTIRKLTGFCTRWRLGGYVVVNLFAYRATDPSVLERVLDPAGPRCDEYIRKALEDAHGPIVVGWGANTRMASRRPDKVLDIIIYGAHKNPLCLGTNKDGSPKHPLMLPYSTELVPFYGPRG